MRGTLGPLFIRRKLLWRSNVSRVSGAGPDTTWRRATPDAESTRRGGGAAGESHTHQGGGCKEEGMLVVGVG